MKIGNEHIESEVSSVYTLFAHYLVDVSILGLFSNASSNV
jgi:hypothetical protein